MCYEINKQRQVDLTCQIMGRPKYSGGGDVPPSLIAINTLDCCPLTGT